MHEVAAMQGVVRTILETMRQAGGSRITHVQLVLGASGHFTEEAAHQHFEALTASTPAEGASLSISWIPATFQCFSCLYCFESCQTAEQVSCPRCSDIALQIGHQHTCSVSAIEVTFEESSFAVASTGAET
jgi:hydrogenase nickel insertion protein HypA